MITKMRLIAVSLALCVCQCALSIAQDWQPATITRTADGREWYHDGARWVEVTRTQCQGGQCNPNGIYYRQVPQQQQQPREWSQPAPQYQPRPIVKVGPVTVPPSASDGQALLGWRDQMEKKIAALEAKCGQSQPGQPGPAGPPGPQGPAGPAGSGEKLDYDKIISGVNAHINTDEFAKDIAAKLPPVIVELEQLDGTKKTQSRPLGQPIKLKLTQRALELD
jgi:hypothetical protein